MARQFEGRSVSARTRVARIAVQHDDAPRRGAAGRAVDGEHLGEHPQRLVIRLFDPLVRTDFQ